jgi:glucosamine--fructose-6-phosphate aminotransferase (isomerizing)
MIREIYEQPKAIEQTLTENFNGARRVIEQLTPKKLRMIYFTGSGTSYHACLAVNYALLTLTNLYASTIPASEFPAWIRQTQSEDIVLIAVSQSGESTDVLGAVESAKRSGMRAVGITNTPHSSLVKAAGLGIESKAGQEKAVTATKSFTATLAAAYAFVLELAAARGLPTKNYEELAIELKKTSGKVEKTLQICGDTAQALAREFKEKEFFFILGSGANYPTALEGALKLKESCNLYAEGFATREFLHGPMQLVDSRTPVFILHSKGEAEQTQRLAESFMRFGAPTVVVGRKGERSIPASTFGLDVAPPTVEIFSPLVYVVPLQLYAYHSSVIRGLNPDRPAKLRKVVK